MQPRTILRRRAGALRDDGITHDGDDDVTFDDDPFAIAARVRGQSWKRRRQIP